MSWNNDCNAGADPEKFNLRGMMNGLKGLLNRRMPYWVVMFVLLVVFGLLFGVAFLPHSHRGSDKAACKMHQRNIQQAVREYARVNALKTGDPLDWSKIIGAGQYIERVPVCPTHGTDAYRYLQVIPPTGVLAAQCKDPAHKPLNNGDW